MSCKQCKGAREIDCPACGGGVTAYSYVCTICMGDGMVDCPSCAARGQKIAFWLLWIAMTIFWEALMFYLVLLLAEEMMVDLATPSNRFFAMFVFVILIAIASPVIMYKLFKPIFVKG